MPLTVGPVDLCHSTLFQWRCSASFFSGRPSMVKKPLLQRLSSGRTVSFGKLQLSLEKGVRRGGELWHAKGVEWTLLVFQWGFPRYGTWWSKLEGLLVRRGGYGYGRLPNGSLHTPLFDHNLGLHKKRKKYKRKEIESERKS